MTSSGANIAKLDIRIWDWIFALERLKLTAMGVNYFFGVMNKVPPRMDWWTSPVTSYWLLDIYVIVYGKITFSIFIQNKVKQIFIYQIRGWHDIVYAIDSIGAVGDALRRHQGKIYWNWIFGFGDWIFAGYSLDIRWIFAAERMKLTTMGIHYYLGTLNKVPLRIDRVTSPVTS